MFEGLTGRLGDIFDRLRKRGALTEDDVNAALREVRVALLEADVALPAVKAFVAGVKEKAIGQEVLRGINPGQMVIKIVHDHLVELLGETSEAINLTATPPVPVLMLGLQGSGKTTTSAKIALRLKTREKKKVLLASLDTRRPAAQEQLKVLADQVGVASLPIIPGQTPVEIARRAIETGRLEGFDVVMLDTAGRLSIDEELMAEVVAIRDATRPVESLLVVDAMTGQDAVTVATNFNEKVGITGIVMTRIDGDARGGAALSMRHVTGKPIKLLGVGEKVDALEAFHPDRIAGRILGMGDVVSLVEKAAETIDKDEAEKLARKMEKGSFDLDDMLSQLRQIKKMGGMGGMLGLLPGVGKIKEQMKNANIDESILKRQEAIIQSMTKKERKTPAILNASRRRRIALGSGTTVADVNRLIKQYQDMSEMMKKMKKLGQKGLMRQGLSALMPKGMR
ncbi:signal recognition particle protein [Oleisolibacter albus]|uniref:signal recognition particle protein n=1 Tax=Oleisolibacter albus TaxID=2171757 RepID=UPI000DF3D829|nr:signal recognition particle protein [Oleisolibacter albus]